MDKCSLYMLKRTYSLPSNRVSYEQNFKTGRKSDQF